MNVLWLMWRASYPVSGLKVAFVSYDPLEKGRNPDSCLALEMALTRRTHMVLDCLHLMGDSVQQIGRVKEWAEVGCAVQIAEWTLETNVDLKTMIG